MSDTPQEQPQTPPEGENAPPSVEPLSPPQPDNTDVAPVGQTDQAAAGEPDPNNPANKAAVDASEDPNLGHALEDQKQGVGVAPTDPGDAGEGNPGTAFQTTEQVEGGTTDSDDTAEHI